MMRLSSDFISSRSMGLAVALGGLAAGAGCVAWVLRDRGGERDRRRMLRAERRLVKAILGNSKKCVATILGPPRASAGFAAVAPAMIVAADFWQADLWYYPLRRSDAGALAIEFSNEIAQKVEVVQITIPQSVISGMKQATVSESHLRGR